MLIEYLEKVWTGTNKAIDSKPKSIENCEASHYGWEYFVTVLPIELEAYKEIFKSLLHKSQKRLYDKWL